MFFCWEEKASNKGGRKGERIWLGGGGFFFEGSYDRIMRIIYS